MPVHEHYALYTKMPMRMIKWSLEHQCWLRQEGPIGRHQRSRPPPNGIRHLELLGEATIGVPGTTESWCRTHDIYGGACPALRGTMVA